MRNSSELFDMQVVVGVKLENILAERLYTKARFCSDAGISRPTLDKVLSGSITSKTSYTKHIEKILSCLDMTPDMLLGSIYNKYNNFHSLRDVIDMDDSDLVRFAGVSIERLKEIEAGAYAEPAELRDLAVAFLTGMKDVLGENYFPTQITTMDLVTRKAKNKDISGAGYWGYVGIRPLQSNEFLWYPITGNTYGMIRGMMEDKRMVIPCMNDKVLLLNMKNIGEVVLLDDDCDMPGFTDEDPRDEEGIIPMVFYESLREYLEYADMGETPPAELFSANFCVWMDRLINEKYGEVDVAFSAQDEINIYYPDGQCKSNYCEFLESESVSDEIALVYEFGEDAWEDRFLYYTDYSGSKIFFNLEVFSVLELSLTAVERKICESDEE